MDLSVLMILFYIPAILFASDDSEGSITTVISYLFATVSLIFAILTFSSFLNVFKEDRTKSNMVFMAIPIVLTLVIFVVYKHTDDKINMPYFLKASNPSNKYGYEYYFSKDSTLKTRSSFKLGEIVKYQNFRLRGDTILLDTILEFTELQSKKYLKTIISDSLNQKHKVLVPVTQSWELLYTKFITIYVEEENYP